MVGQIKMSEPKQDEEGILNGESLSWGVREKVANIEKEKLRMNPVMFIWNKCLL